VAAVMAGVSERTTRQHALSLQGVPGSSNPGRLSIHQRLKLVPGAAPKGRLVGGTTGRWHGWPLAWFEAAGWQSAGWTAPLAWLKS
jgi:hypothetical protein